MKTEKEIRKVLSDLDKAEIQLKQCGCIVCIARMMAADNFRRALRYTVGDDDEFARLLAKCAEEDRRDGRHRPSLN